MTTDRSILWVRVAALALFAAPAASAIWAQAQVPLFFEGFQQFAAAVKQPWIAMTVCDLFTGFACMSLWILYRERRLWVSLALIGSLWFFGNMVVAAYVLALTFIPGVTLQRILLGRAAPVAMGNNF
ncbi:MAG: hypothetical protein JWQ90_184 [Hydrocarboniphaga sp.]|nr:hypothetical protein [Hydrocarboniphaga sp.]